MTKWIIILALLALGTANARSQESIVPYAVKRIVKPMKQPKDMDCWITVVTMMLNWKNSTNHTVEQTVKDLSDPWIIYFETNTGLPATEQAKFMKKIGLVAEPPANYMLRAYVDLLKSSGPLWIITGGITAHARLLVAVEGDGNYESTWFIFIDPEAGKQKRENSILFFKKFEAEAKMANSEKWKEDLRIQIYHF